MELAQTSFPNINVPTTGTPAVNINSTNIGQIITSLYPYIFGGAGILILIYFLIGGIELMTSAGDPKKVQSARDKITGALIGFVIIFVAYWIVQLVSLFLGVGALRSSF